MTTWPFVPTRPVILDEYNDMEARYGAFGPPVSVRERIPIRHKITEAETAPGLVGGFRYVPPQDLVPDWPATAQLTPPSAQRPVTQLHDGLEREQDCLRLEQRSVPVTGQRLAGAFAKEPADHHRVHDHTHRPGAGHASANASWNAIQSLSLIHIS